MRHYPAKILLLGEYTVLDGSAFLTIPFNERSLTWHKQKELRPDERLSGFLRYLERSDLPLDLKSFDGDIMNGYYLHSEIPSGYGLGSSGAVCAAIYDRYALEPSKDLNRLHRIFCQMEAYFHGQSSGLDPLVSYYNRPIYRSKEKIKVLESWGFPEGLTFFLLKKKKKRNTNMLVSRYKESIGLKIKPLLDELPVFLSAFIKKEAQLLIAAYKNISTLQFSLFGPMIPDSIRPIWQAGLESNTYYIKLCGAGGGGYFLGMSEEMSAFDFGADHIVLLN